MTEFEQRALAFASAAHGAIGQKRKYTNDSYIVHPIAVAEIVRTVPHDPFMIAAAYLHDVVEDTKVTLEDILRHFNAEVCNLVYWLTDLYRSDDPLRPNRAARKEIQRAHIAKAPRAAKTIKLADLIDNSRSIFKHDPDFARVYAREMEALLDVLSDANPTLLRMAKDQLEEYTGIIH